MATVRTTVPLALATVNVSADAEGYFAEIGDWFVEVRDGQLIVRARNRNVTLLQVPVTRHAD